MIFDMNGFDTGGIFDTFAVTFEIESQGNISTHMMDAPQIIVQNQFVNLVQQAVQIDSPCRIKMSRIVQIYDGINHTTKNIEHYLEVKNNAYLNNE